MRLSRAAYYRPPVPASRRDAAVIAALTDVVARYPRWGFWKCFDRLRVEGRSWNHKHVHRVYCALRLNLPRRTTRRVPRRARQPLTAPPVLNRTWALDFMSETLYDGRRVRLLTVIDEDRVVVSTGRPIRCPRSDDQEGEGARTATVAHRLPGRWGAHPVLSKNPIDAVRRADSTLDARRVATFVPAESLRSARPVCRLFPTCCSSSSWPSRARSTSSRVTSWTLSGKRIASSESSSVLAVSGSPTPSAGAGPHRPSASGDGDAVTGTPWSRPIPSSAGIDS